MNKLYIKDMTDEQLNEWAAKARGWTQDDSPDHWDTGEPFSDSGVNFIIAKQDYDPVHNGSQMVDLVVEFDMCLQKVIPTKGFFGDSQKFPWAASTDVNYRERGGSTPNKAVVHAAIASKYGEYVEIEEERL